MKEITEDNNKSPTTIIKDVVIYTSPKEIADIMVDSFIDKVENIRNNINSNPYKAIDTYKKIIPRVEDQFKLEKVTVSDVYEVIGKQKSSNARGNDEITSRMMKEIPQYLSLALCHLFNSMVTTGIFSESLKIARLTPILKLGKSSTDPLSF